MIQGFVTLATGDERYYRLARNLLRSYRHSCSTPMRFAIIADRHNAYTAEFDDVVIMEHATRSWADKLEMLKCCPYDENIFLDADCLVYQDINFFWDIFSGMGDFSCFGRALPLGSEGGWFSDQALEVYPVHFLTHLHGMLYFIRKGATVDQMYELCTDIVSNYHKIRFKYFNDCLADEPVFALAMAVMNLKPVPRVPEYYCFVPFAIDCKADFLSKCVHFTYPEEGRSDRCCIIHWGNINTRMASYRVEEHKINYLCSVKNGVRNRVYEMLFYRTRLLYTKYRIEDGLKAVFKKSIWYLGRVKHKLFAGK